MNHDKLRIYSSPPRLKEPDSPLRDDYAKEPSSSMNGDSPARLKEPDSPLRDDDAFDAKKPSSSMNGDSPARLKEPDSPLRDDYAKEPSSSMNGDSPARLKEPDSPLRDDKESVSQYKSDISFGESSPSNLDVKFKATESKYKRDDGVTFFGSDIENYDNDGKDDGDSDGPMFDPVAANRTMISQKLHEDYKKLKEKYIYAKDCFNDYAGVGGEMEMNLKHDLYDTRTSLIDCLNFVQSKMNHISYDPIILSRCLSDIPDDLKSSSASATAKVVSQTTSKKRKGRKAHNGFGKKNRNLKETKTLPGKKNPASSLQARKSQHAKPKSSHHSSEAQDPKHQRSYHSSNTHDRRSKSAHGSQDRGFRTHGAGNNYSLLPSTPNHTTIAPLTPKVFRSPKVVRDKFVPYNPNDPGTANILKYHTEHELQDFIVGFENIKRQFTYIGGQLLRIITPAKNNEYGNANMSRKNKQNNNALKSFSYRAIYMFATCSSKKKNSSDVFYIVETAHDHKKLFERNSGQRDNGTQTIGTTFMVVNPEEVTYYINGVPCVCSSEPLVPCHPINRDNIPIPASIPNEDIRVFYVKNGTIEINSITWVDAACTNGRFCDRQRVREVANRSRCGCFSTKGSAALCTPVFDIQFECSSGVSYRMNEFSSLQFLHLFAKGEFKHGYKSVQFNIAERYKFSPVCEQMNDLILNNGKYDYFGWVKQGSICDYTLVGNKDDDEYKRYRDINSKISSDALSVHLCYIAPSNADFFDPSSRLYKEVQLLKYDCAFAV